MDGRSEWVALFAEAIIEAAGLAQQMGLELAKVQDTHRALLIEERRHAGQRAPRQGSAVLRLLEDITAHPVETAATAAGRLGISTVAARDALEELTRVGVYRTGKIDKGKTMGYLATRILDLADDVAGRGSVPARSDEEPPRPPDRTARRHRAGDCGYPLSAGKAWCTERPGYSGQHRQT